MKYHYLSPLTLNDAVSNVSIFNSKSIGISLSLLLF